MCIASPPIPRGTHLAMMTPIHDGDEGDEGSGGGEGARPASRWEGEAQALYTTTLTHLADLMATMSDGRNSAVAGGCREGVGSCGVGGAADGGRVGVTWWGCTG